MSSPSFSIIICSIDAGKFARTSESYRHLFRQHDHEIIGIHDAKSLAEGYNRGIGQSTGEILIFSHDDVLFIDDALPDKLASHLQHFDVLGFAGTSKLITGNWFAAGQPHIHGVVAHARPKQAFMSLDVFGVDDWPVVQGIKAIDGLCMISTREVAEKVGFDAATFDGFHLYDLDFSFSAWKTGYKLGVCCDIPIIHESAGNFDERHHRYKVAFFKKHQDDLDSGKELYTPNGRGIFLKTPAAVQRAWQQALLQRTTISLRRSC
ncbi:MAG: glycosyltransferase [Propionivibrio sp.]